MGKHDRAQGETGNELREAVIGFDEGVHDFHEEMLLSPAASAQCRYRIAVMRGAHNIPGIHVPQRSRKLPRST
jgi:hypothetical protein